MKSESIFQSSYPRLSDSSNRRTLWKDSFMKLHFGEQSQRIKLKLRKTSTKELNCFCKSLPSVLGKFERSLPPFYIRKTNLWQNRRNGNFNDSTPHSLFPRGLLTGTIQIVEHSSIYLRIITSRLSGLIASTKFASPSCYWFIRVHSFIYIYVCMHTLI